MTETTNGTALVIREYPKLAEVTGFSSAQISLIRQTVGLAVKPAMSIPELAWYLYNAKRLDLEPMLDQIYPIRYKATDPIEIVVGINGYRKQADDSGAYAGSDDPVFEYEEVGQPKRGPSKATVTVWKIVQGMRVPFTASARWEEFYPGDGPIGAQYRKRPHNQLAVRAESHALRKAFPYQTARLEPQPVPTAWIEAATEDEVHQKSPERQAALATKYEQTFGDDDAGTAFADLPTEPAHPEAEAEPADVPLPASAQQGRDAAQPTASRRRPGAYVPTTERDVDDAELDRIAEQQSKVLL